MEDSESNRMGIDDALAREPQCTTQAMARPADEATVL
jgi:hypothetical protein